MFLIATIAILASTATVEVEDLQIVTTDVASEEIVFLTEEDSESGCVSEEIAIEDEVEHLSEVDLELN